MAQSNGEKKKPRLIELPCIFCERPTMFDPDDDTGPGRTCNKCKKKHRLEDTHGTK